MTKATPTATRSGLIGMWPVLAAAALIGVAAQIVGPLKIPVGHAAITILPMVWAILLGGAVSAQRWRPVPIRLQYACNEIMGVSVLLLVASLSFTIGPNIPVLFSAGPALLLQEVGHLFGTIVLALPVAVLLRMGPATVGATFSIDREGSFAMVSERYGPNSPQYRGVLAMYIFGTLFGAVFISLLASLAASTGVFDAKALAMGAGVGSGSMMAAAAAAVSAEFPALQSQVLALAATSNVITGLLGVYVGVWIALPLADRAYKFLTRKRPAEQASAQTDNTDLATEVTASHQHRVPLWASLTILTVIGTVVSTIAAKHWDWRILAGYLIFDVLLVAGFAVNRLAKRKIPALLVVVTLGALVASPWSPIAGPLVHVTQKVDFISICTVVLTFAGLSIGKDLPLLGRIGWRIVPVGLIAITASYLFAVVLAEFALGLWH